MIFNALFVGFFHFLFKLCNFFFQRIQDFTDTLTVLFSEFLRFFIKNPTSEIFKFLHKFFANLLYFFFLLSKFLLKLLISLLYAAIFTNQLLNFFFLLLNDSFSCQDLRFIFFNLFLIQLTLSFRPGKLLL